MYVYIHLCIYAQHIYALRTLLWRHVVAQTTLMGCPSSTRPLLLVCMFAPLPMPSSFLPLRPTLTTCTISYPWSRARLVYVSTFMTLKYIQTELLGFETGCARRAFEYLSLAPPIYINAQFKAIYWFYRHFDLLSWLKSVVLCGSVSNRTHRP